MSGCNPSFTVETLGQWEGDGEAKTVIWDREAKCEYINANNIHQQTTIFSNIEEINRLLTALHFLLKYIFRRGRELCMNARQCVS